MPSTLKTKGPFILGLYDKLKTTAALIPNGATKTDDGKVGRALWDPPQAVKDRTMQVIKDYQVSNTTRNKPYREFNDMSLVQRISLDEASFGQFVEPSSLDPAQAWRSQAFRPIVRNKIITIAAHLTASIIYPKVYAQNENDDEDRDAATVMQDLMEWAGEQAGYDKTFMYAVIQTMVDPCTFLHTEYTERYREIKELIDEFEATNASDPKKKQWKARAVLDELWSGFQDSVVPCDEMWIGNIYEPEVQKQPFLIRRRVIDYETVRAKYGGNPIFDKYVTPGVQFLYSDEQNLFYFQYDFNLIGNLCEEVIYMNRSGDMELHFVNGILLDDPDNPNPRRDKKYPYAKAGYEIIHPRFFYFKSLAFKLTNDEQIVNTAYRMLADGTYLQIMPPAVNFGNETIDTTVIVPGMVTTISNEGNPAAAFQTIETKNNLQSAYQLLDKVEGSISESSTDSLQTGSVPSGGSDTAFEVSRIEQNAKVMLGLFAKMIGYMVYDFGMLRMSDIIQFLTVGDVMDTLSAPDRLKFKTFILPDRVVDGKSKTKKIVFDAELPDTMSEKQKMKYSYDIYQQEDKVNNTTCLYKVNPTLFRDLKYKCVVVPEALTPKSDSLKKAMMLEQYGLAIANPIVNKEAVTRDLLFGAYDKTKDEPDKYIMQTQGMPQFNLPQPGGQGQPGAATMAAGAAPYSAQARV